LSYIPSGYEAVCDMNVHCPKCDAMVWNGETVGIGWNNFCSADKFVVGISCVSNS
jgi:hypothetical protein